MLILDGLLALLTELYNQAEREHSDPEVLTHKLLDLQTKYEWGEIDEEHYQKEFAEIKERLETARALAEDDEEEEEEE